MSMSPSRPMASSPSESVKRPSRDGSRGGFRGAGGAPRPGYGSGLLAYGPCGANGGRYPVDSVAGGGVVADGGNGAAGGGSLAGGVYAADGVYEVGAGYDVGGLYAGGGAAPDVPPDAAERCSELRFTSRTAAAISATTTSHGRTLPNTTEPTASMANSATITTRAGDVLDRPRPSSASSGEPVSPSDGIISQTTTYTSTLTPPASVSTANSTRHSTGSVLVARPIAAHTPASIRPCLGRTRPYRVAQPAVPGGGGGNPPGGGNPAPPNGGSGRGGRGGSADRRCVGLARRGAGRAQRGGRPVPRRRRWWWEFVVGVRRGRGIARDAHGGVIRRCGSGPVLRPVVLLLVHGSILAPRPAESPRARTLTRP